LVLTLLQKDLLFLKVYEGGGRNREEEGEEEKPSFFTFKRKTKKNNYHQGQTEGSKRLMSAPTPKDRH
jgi:hypothetical protein